MERNDKNPESIQKSPATSDALCSPPPQSSTSPATDHQSTPNARTSHEPEEKAKRTKHSRVSKREKELYGLVTPVFLPLLDARESSPKQEKSHPMDRHAHATATSESEQPPASRDVEKNSKENRKMRREHKDAEAGAGQGEAAKENQHTEPTKKSRRSAIKKSALRQHNSSRTRRKRVSLVIDGQTVLPADTVVEPPLTSPSETTSASNSTTSLDDMIDPRLTRHDPPTHTEHHEAVHHSLPLPMSNNLHATTKPLLETPTSLQSSTLPIAPAYNPPSTALHTFLHNPSSIPATAGPDPIFADDFTETDEADDAFSTYVGGLHGSGVDDLDQAGSVGYPSSLGASYLESYMQSRPLRVRMDAADKAGLSEEEKRMMLTGGHANVQDDDEELGMEIDGKGVWHSSAKNHDEVDDEMDIVGSMEGF